MSKSTIPAQILILTVVCAAGILWLAAFEASPHPERLPACYAVDGDTLNCDGERIRLLGLDAPEKQERGGDYATEVLRAIALGPLKVERQGKDRYGRTLGHVYGADENVACTLIAANAAAYVEKWDNLPQGRVARECGL